MSGRHTSNLKLQAIASSYLAYLVDSYLKGKLRFGQDSERVTFLFIVFSAFHSFDFLNEKKKYFLNARADKIHLGLEYELR